MRTLRKNILGLCLVGMGLGVGAPTQAATGVGPYYAMPSWDQTLPAATRFIVLTNMNSEAVLDRETGLVWEQSPSTADQTWREAFVVCIQKTVGSRKGWRLPTIQELASLFDPANPGDPGLPPGHPFSNVRSFIFYWSATVSTFNTNTAWVVFTANGDSSNVTTKLSPAGYWCVRGGQGPDTQ